jgi:hypothetical protein
MGNPVLMKVSESINHLNEQWCRFTFGQFLIFNNVAKQLPTFSIIHNKADYSFGLHDLQLNNE